MEKLLKAMREKRKMETRTLDGYKFFPTSESGSRLYQSRCNQLEILQNTVSGQNKTAIRKYCKKITLL